MRHIRASDYIDEHEQISLKKFLVKPEMFEDTHTHNFIEIEYIWSGHGFQTVNDTTYPVKRGDLIFIDINHRHAYHTDSQMGVINCLLTHDFFRHNTGNPEDAPDILTLSCFHNYHNFVGNTSPKTSFQGKALLEIETIIDCMIAEYNGKVEGYLNVLKSYINVFLSSIFRSRAQGQQPAIPSNVRTRAFSHIMNYIEEHYAEKLSLQNLARMYAYTPNYLSKAFRDHAGKNFITYLHEVRVGKAMQLLKETDSSVEDICHSVGYNDKKQFYAVFKSLTGLTPGQYRDTA